MRNKKLVDYGKFGYIFSIPFILAFLVFSLYPILYTLLIGFTDLKGLMTTEIHVLWKEPFKNFVTVLKSNLFRKSFTNTVVIWIMNFIPQMGLALPLTAWFTDRRSKVKGQGLFKILEEDFDVADVAEYGTGSLVLRDEIFIGKAEDAVYDQIQSDDLTRLALAAGEQKQQRQEQQYIESRLEKLHRQYRHSGGRAQ